MGIPKIPISPVSNEHRVAILRSEVTELKAEVQKLKSTVSELAAEVERIRQRKH